MNKSTKSPEVDLDANSILNNKSQPNSPFLAVSPFLGNQYNFSRSRNPQAEQPRIYTKLFDAPNFGAIFDSKHASEQQKPERAVNLPSIQDWLAPLADLRECNGYSSMGSNPFSKFNNVSLGTAATLDKPKAVATGTSFGTKGISTDSMVLVSHKAKQDSSNFHVKENIAESDEQRFNLTTIYLKRFNMFSNSCVSMPTFEDMPAEPLKLIAPHKKIKKLLASTNMPKTGKHRAGERKTKRKITCNCKNSRCVKMYCECFRENGFCGPHCKCKDCKNFENSDERANSIGLMHKKQADEFAFKLSREEVQAKPAGEARGCKCKKSQCQKKYCECYNEGAFCGPDCGCVDCLNGERKR